MTLRFFARPNRRLLLALVLLLALQGPLILRLAHRGRYGPLWETVFLLAVVALETVWRWRTPLISIDPKSIEIRLHVASRRIHLAFSEIDCWSHTDRVLGLMPTSRRPVFASLYLLRESDRTGLLQELTARLGQANVGALTPEMLALRVRNRKLFVWGVLATAVAYWAYLTVRPHLHGLG